MKKKTWKSCIALLMAGLLLTVSPVYADNGLTDATVQTYEDRLKDAQAQQQRALNELASIRDQQANTWEEIAQIDYLISINSELKRIAEEQLDSVGAQIESKKAKIAETEQKIAQQEQTFRNRMVENYMEDDVDYIELILGSKSLVDFLTNLDRVLAILEYDREIIDDLETNRQTLEQDKAALIEQEDLETQRVLDFESIIQDNEYITAEKERVMQELQNDESKWLDEYTYNKQLENQINAELEEYLAELQRKSQSTYVGGVGGWPLEQGAYYYVSSEFGWRIIWGVDDYHLGIDLACDAGTNVYAYNAGTVLKSESHYSYGNYVLIDHGGGIATLYAHMTDCLVYEGQYVEAGQQVGYVGMTGSATGYHLHFEVRENGSVVNPRGYLAFP